MSSNLALMPDAILFRDGDNTIVGSIFASSDGMVISSSDLNDTKVEGNLNVTEVITQNGEPLDQIYAALGGSSDQAFACDTLTASSNISTTGSISNGSLNFDGQYITSSISSPIRFDVVSESIIMNPGNFDYTDEDRKYWSFDKSYTSFKMVRGNTSNVPIELKYDGNLGNITATGAVECNTLSVSGDISTNGSIKQNGTTLNETYHVKGGSSTQNFACDTLTASGNISTNGSITQNESTLDETYHVKGGSSTQNFECNTLTANGTFTANGEIQSYNGIIRMYDQTNSNSNIIITSGANNNPYIKLKSNNVDTIKIDGTEGDIDIYGRFRIYDGDSSTFTGQWNANSSGSYLYLRDDSTWTIGLLGDSGQIKATSTILENQSTVTSDDRLKHNETQITNALETVTKINAMNYYKTRQFYDSDKIFPSDEIPSDATYESGYIAQEIQSIPELAHLVHGQELDASDNPTSLSLNYTGIQPFLCRAIQELSVKNTELEAKNIDLETRLATVEATLAALTSTSSN